MSLTWDIPLASPPDIVTISRNAHGFQNVDRFLLRDLWSLHIYGYHATLSVDGVSLTIRPGYVSVIPPGKITEYRYVGLSVHLFVHFKLKNALESVRISAMQDLAQDFEPCYQNLLEVRGRSDPFAQSRVWELLWTLSQRMGVAQDSPVAHPAVVVVEEIIDQNLQGDLTVADLAIAANVSYGYLSQLFFQAKGCTVAQWIKQRRVERAVHLLTHSTLPIKLIASSVGIPDIHYFNKVIRKATGNSPSGLRLQHV